MRQTGKQTAENLQRDRYHKGISEYRQRQTEEILHRDVPKEREGKREKEEEQRSE